MNLSNIIKYADKIGITETSHGANIENVTYTNNYFFGVSVSVPAVRFYFDYTECNYYTMQKKADMIKKYCSRYGLEVAYNGGCFGVFAFSVFVPADLESYQIISEYSDLSVQEWEKMQHTEYSHGNYNINELGRSIMDKWERAYLECINNNIIAFPA